MSLLFKDIQDQRSRWQTAQGLQYLEQIKDVLTNGKEMPKSFLQELFCEHIGRKYYDCRGILLVDISINQYSNAAMSFEGAYLKSLLVKDSRMFAGFWANAHFTDVEFSGCLLSAVQAPHAHFERCHFEKSHVDSGVFDHSVMTDVVFDSVDLTGTSFLGVKFNNTKFINCDLDHINLSDSIGKPEIINR